MAKNLVGLWMYQNCGGDVIEEKMVSQLREREIETVTKLDLANGFSFNGHIFCNGTMMNELDLFFSYNAGQQSQYQTYLYQALNETVPTINNYHSFALTEDKFRTAHHLKLNGIATTDHIVCNKNNIQEMKEHLAFWGGQAICKPIDGWGGRGIIKLESERDIDLLTPYINAQASPQFYIERVVENDYSDYRIDIVDGKYIACYGRKAAKGEWKTNITSGGSVMLREPNDAVVELALKAAKVTGLEVAGVDIIYDIEHEKYVVLEVNGIPAFATPEQEKYGLDFNNKKIATLVDLIERTVTKPQLSTTSINVQEASYAVTQ